MLECDLDYAEEIAEWLEDQEAAILDHASDACDTNMLSIVNDYEPGSEFVSCGKVSGLKVTFTVADACENTSTCTAYIYIDDTTPPVLTCVPYTPIFRSDLDYAEEIAEWLEDQEAAILDHASDAC